MVVVGERGSPKVAVIEGRVVLFFEKTILENIILFSSYKYYNTVKYSYIFVDV